MQGITQRKHNKKTLFSLSSSSSSSHYHPIAHLLDKNINHTHVINLLAIRRVHAAPILLPERQRLSIHRSRLRRQLSLDGMNTQQQGIINDTAVSQELAVSLQLGVEELGIFRIEENVLVQIYDIQILKGACNITSLLVGSALGE